MLIAPAPPSGSWTHAVLILQGLSVVEEQAPNPVQDPDGCGHLSSPCHPLQYNVEKSTTFGTTRESNKQL